ncbi:hypothetical protein JOQ06_029938 [Pogonophryne albipinna]|uniref:Uncharacterized protein n=1 Tax=Pogonophryne albipinna TaxID=1090488 RepID=A0AAD6FGR8_9TELE|nr:hypothetical protein JOQ06_029938 [Pogonophryne albipinna]
MGCTTSAVVFDGLRTVLERNCSDYICKGGEPIGPSEAERALSRRESRAFPTPRVLKDGKMQDINVINDSNVSDVQPFHHINKSLILLALVLVSVTFD